ncbi:MAG: hypothetical protein KBT00_04605 [Bacteroidales bacterium]|nr:hypothetical protein [Candidatus Cacconaster merdequi]
MIPVPFPEIYARIADYICDPSILHDLIIIIDNLPGVYLAELVMSNQRMRLCSSRRVKCQCFSIKIK